MGSDIDWIKDKINTFTTKFHEKLELEVSPLLTSWSISLPLRVIYCFTSFFSLSFSWL